MKNFIISLLVGLALTAIAAAGGITGKVQDSRGNGKSGITVTVKTGGQSNSVKTAEDGTYTVVLPATANGTRTKVYVDGRYVTTCLIPVDGSFSRVNVTFK